MKNIIILVLALLVEVQSEVNGVISLDSLSFNKTLEAFAFSFVKFDTKPPSGTKHEVFLELTKELNEHKKILMAEVQIPGYGQRDNHDLSVRFDLSQGILPEFIFFTRIKSKNEKLKFNMTRYGGEISKDEFKRFLQRKSGLWIGLPGCMKKYDDLAVIFSKNSGKDRKKVISQIERMIEAQQSDEEEIEVSKKYLKVMKNLEIKGDDFLNQEITRLEKLLSSKKKISLAKKSDLQKNLNILKSFTSSNQSIKDEL